MSIDEEIARLRGVEATARQRHASAAARHAQAEAKAASAREDLQAEFGVATVEEARVLLGTLDSQVEAEAGRVRELLALAGGAQ